MGIHPFQIADLNQQFAGTSSIVTNEGSYASEFGILPDNINANCSRYMKLQGTWANINIGSVSTSPSADSYGQGTGASNQANTSSIPYRPNGGYFVRGLYFTNTAIPANDSTGNFRVGYIGSFVGGMINCDYAHDPNGSTVDYEPIYSHGAATWPMTASQAKQWRDPVNPPSDGTDLISNSSSALTRTIYMPASYMILHIDSVGSNTLGSGNVSFHFENRPSLRMAGFNDANGVNGVVPAWAGTAIPIGFGNPYPYPSDVLRQQGSLSGSASDNFHELFQVTGVRKLNSRGLSFHLAKVHDNGATAYAYPYEEDGSTLGTGVTVTSSNIQAPFTYVNDQQEYVWAGGRDRGASILTTTLTSNVVTFTTPFNNFVAGDVILIQGLTSGNGQILNGALLTVLSTGLSSTQFEANYTHANWVTTSETSGGTAVKFQDSRVRQAATFIINEEYYGFVADTKCTIWSNKASMFPLVFFDLADTWTASTAKRIAGVAVVPVYINATGAQAWQIFFLSEDGKLARYDFTQTNGVLELAGSGSFAFASSAPAVSAAGEAYGSFRARSTTSTITNVAVATNVLTVQCVNTFEPGEIVNLQGLTTATFLNNQTVTVSTASGSQFTAAYTHADYPSAADTGTAVGYSLWALYGTMSPDPRLTQTGLANNANINLYRYLIGTGVWGSKIASPNTGRHNGRSLSEMIVARDSKLYILCEDVATSAGFTVSNAFTQTFPQGPFNVNWQVMAYDPVAAAWNASKINGTTLLQYGTNMGPNGVVQNDPTHFWFYQINAFLHDVAPNRILIQSNWTLGALQVLNVSGSTSALANANLSTVSAGTLVSGNSGLDAFSITHARDFATNADRTVFLQHDQIRTAPSSVSIYLAPPSYNWGSPTLLQVIQRNSYGSNPPAINSFDKDHWSYGDLNATGGSFTNKYAWTFPTMLTDNYIHFIRGSANIDGLPTSCIYGRSFGQTIAYLPTYFKWTGSAWTMADSWTDASSSPRLVPAANTNVALPYGLQVQFGPLSSTSYTFGEFHTWNMCYGNTKFARKMRQSWSNFAGQTFTNTDTRTVASQNALTMYLVDTDLGSVTNTAPTSATPSTATLTNNPAGWVTQSTWHKLDGVNAPFDATAYSTVWTPLNFNTSTYAFPGAANVSGSGPGPYSWTANSVTYQVQANGENGGSLAWFAVAGNPQAFWQSNTSNTGTLAVDLGSAKTVLTYGFRPVYSGSDTLDGSVPKSWTLEGSNTSLTSGFSTVDTRSNITSYNRGAAFTVGSPGSFRYYRMNISATQTGGAPTLQFFQLNTSALQTTVNMSEMVLYAYGTGIGASYNYKFIRNWQMARGIKLEVSTNGGGSYTTVFAPGGPQPLWRAHNGYVFTFPRQIGVTNVRITVQHGYNYSTASDSPNQPLITGFGPFYFIDYGDNGGSYGSAGSTLINAARLGNSLAPVGTAPAASFDPNCLGIATDVPNISIDGGNPSLLTPYSVLVDGAVHGFWDFSEPGSSQFKVHPFFGFTFFQGAGAQGSVSNQTGTNAVINYQWGRRV